MRRSPLYKNPWKKEQKMPEKVNLMCLRDMKKVFEARVC